MGIVRYKRAHMDGIAGPKMPVRRIGYRGARRLVAGRGTPIEPVIRMYVDGNQLVIRGFANVNRPRTGQVAVGQNVLALGGVLVYQVAGYPVGIRGQLRPPAMIRHVVVKVAAL